MICHALPRLRRAERPSRSPRRRTLAPRALALSVLLALPWMARAQDGGSAPPSGGTTQERPVELPYGERAEVQAFAAAVGTRHPELEPAAVLRTLAGANYQPSVARLIMPAAQSNARNWSAYRSRMVDPVRVRAGVEFRQRHAGALQRAEQQYGVPADIVVAIIGIETLYGRHTGTFRAIDALSTLAFDFPSGRSDRSAFFRDELEALLVLAAREGVDAAEIRSSYAGALGLPQFMPGSWLQHAVDFDGDGRIDLHRNPVDAIGSVARYLANAGWQRGVPTHYAVQPPADPASLATLLKPDILPSFTAAEFTRLGAVLEPAALAHTGPLALVELRNGLEQPPSHVAGTANFWAVTRYNWSAYYAMAVIELARTITLIDTARQARP
ncbi:membrane-bound lytic murein transglycosylase B [Sphaerotilus hippei]|uniref:Membrane-bound lytic murein transglycosylase B n=1 Tax=Sphaerotilus hippei TaxID=744406 RepID=A0A318GXY6_9BURK|nr:lytic murein transglycosylase B [Sphaerotilus hippei]PXW94769.1 membrane-bound lytic murein transglycosylase B [Sphaerotilus hippei]